MQTYSRVVGTVGLVKEVVTEHKNDFIKRERILAVAYPRSTAGVVKKRDYVARVVVAGGDGVIVHLTALFILTVHTGPRVITYFIGWCINEEVVVVILVALHAIPEPVAEAFIFTGEGILTYQITFLCFAKLFG